VKSIFLHRILKDTAPKNVSSKTLEGGRKATKLKKAIYFVHLSQIKIMITIIPVKFLILSLSSTCYDGVVKPQEVAEFLKRIDVTFVL
jgi:hypothetical protein